MNGHRWKRIVAREWLIFLGCVFAASALMTTSMIVDQEPFSLELVLFGGVFFYGLLFLVRSVIWAVRTLRAG